MRNINRFTLTNERTVLLTCDLYKHILACFEMFPCESEPIQEENTTLYQIKFLFWKSTYLQVWKCPKTPTSVWFESFPITFLSSYSFHTWVLKFLHKSFPFPILLISSVNSSRSSKGHTFVPRDQAEPISSFTGKAHIPDLQALCGRLPETQFFPHPGVLQRS